MLIDALRFPLHIGTAPLARQLSNNSCKILYAPSTSASASHDVRKYWEEQSNFDAPHENFRTETRELQAWKQTSSIFLRNGACMSAVVCFGGGHRTLYKKQLYALDVLFRKLCWSNVNTSVRHRPAPRKAWNFTSLERSGHLHTSSWSEILVMLCRQHWKLASQCIFFALRPPESKWNTTTTIP